MRTVSIHIRKIVIASFFTAALTGAHLVSRAAGIRPGADSAGNTAEVKYIPTAEGQGVFHVVYDNAAGDRFVLQVMDGEGNNLFQDIYTDKKFEKNFRLADPDSFSKVVFVIHNLADNSYQRFQVEASTRLEESVRVEEVK